MKTLYAWLILTGLLAVWSGSPVRAQEASAVGGGTVKATELKLNVSTRVLTAMTHELYTTVVAGCGSGHAYGSSWTAACPSPYEAGGLVTYTCLSGHPVITQENCR